MLRKYLIAGKSQKGFTLLELVIALAIGVVISGVLGGALYQILAASNSSSNNIMAIRQVQNAGYYISQDVQQSKPENINVTVQDDVIFSIIWDEVLFTGEIVKEGNKAVYRYDSGNLYRDYYVTENMPYNTEVGEYIFTYDKTSLIAQYIDADISLVKGSTVILNISATVDGWKPGTAERTYKIETRVS